MSPGRDRRALLAAIAVAAALILARSAVYLFYEQSFFDSDQAVFGLMAKHLAEGRALPWFSYGQPYMLAVEAWIAAPFLLIGGPTVMALRSSIIATNIVVAALLIGALVRWARLEPWQALAASVFFTFAPPITAATLVEPAGNITPFLAVIVLWLLRDRPWWFGAVFAVGFFVREFTAYALPVLLVLQLTQRDLFNKSRLRKWAIAAMMALIVGAGIQVMRRFSDPIGPGTRGKTATGYNGSQLGNITGRFKFIPSELPARVQTMATNHVPLELGLKHWENNISTQGHDWLYWPIALVLLCGLGRAVAMSRGHSVWAFPAYLVGVGLTSVAMYAIARPAEQMIDRYFVLVLLAPIGVVAWFLAVERRAVLRATMIAAVLVWTAASGADHLAHLRRYAGGKVPNDIRTLADSLVGLNIKVAKAPYWRAYKLTYLTGERVKVASSDVVRIDEYQDLAEQAGADLITIQEQPCPGGTQVRFWYLCKGR
jgi:hypothetical protein